MPLVGTACYRSGGRLARSCEIGNSTLTASEGNATVSQVTAEPLFFARPEGPAIELGVPPRLATWNVAGDPDQLKLAASLEDADQRLEHTLNQLKGPLALRLDAGLADNISLLREHDLDNYVPLLANRLMKGRSLSLISVWSTKTTRKTSPRAGVRTRPLRYRLVRSAHF